MTLIQVELLTDQGNNAVLRLPGRLSPGVLVQGDSLRNLLNLVAEASASMKRNNWSEAESALQEVADLLEDARERYEGALKEHGIALPY